MEARRTVKLLVVDSQPDFFQNISECAELCSHEIFVECEFADSQRKAESRIASWAPNLVLIDAHVQNGSSFTILDYCKRQASPVVVMSDKHSSAIEDSARARGAVGYITKSNNLEDLERTLHELAEVSEALGNIH